MKVVISIFNCQYILQISQSIIFYILLFLNRAYAKALHYKEDEFLRGGSKDQQVIEALISINNKLQQKEAAEGLLQYVMRQGNEAQVQVKFQILAMHLVHQII